MPAPVTTLSYHVAGPIVPQANIGAANAFVNLGICEDGADIALQQYTHDIKDDGGGGPEGAEVEVIFLNAVAVVRFVLVPFAGTYINKLRAMAQANVAGVDGVMLTPGTLFGTNLNLPTLKLTGNDIDGGWQFTTCRVVQAGSNRVSTKETKLQMEFRAFNFLDPNVNVSINTKTLYSRV